MSVFTFEYSEPMRPNVSSLETLEKPLPQAACDLWGPYQGFVAQGPGCRVRVGGWERSLAKFCSRVWNLNKSCFQLSKYFLANRCLAVTSQSCNMTIIS